MTVGSALLKRSVRAKAVGTGSNLKIIKMYFADGQYRRVTSSKITFAVRFSRKELVGHPCSKVHPRVLEFDKNPILRAMYNPGTTAIIISLLLYDRVEGSFLMDQIVANNDENILQKFFAQYRIHIEIQHGTRDVAVIGASNDQLRTIKPLIEDLPHIIGMNLTKICTSEHWVRNTIVMIFLDSLREERLRKRMKDLSGCKSYQFYLIFESSSAISFENTNSALRLSREVMKKLPIFVHHNDEENSLKFYRYARPAGLCSRRAELIMDWMPGDGMRELDSWFARRSVPTIPCPLNIATTNYPPWVEVDEHAIIKGGFEGKIITEFAKNYNRAIVIPKFEISDSKRSSTREAIVSSCVAGNASIGIGGIRPTKSVTSRVTVSQMYAQECVVWCVPRNTRLKQDPFSAEFSWIVWMLMGIMFFGSFAIEWIVGNGRRHSGEVVGSPDWTRIILNIFGATLGNPILYRPLSVGSKIMMIIHVSYSIVMTTAYKTSLSSMFTVGNVESMIVDVEGIIEANLTTGGDALRLAILEDQRNESEWMPELINRYVIENNVSKALRRVSNDKDCAYLTSYSDISYQKLLFERSGENISFDVLNGCVLIHSVVAITPDETHDSLKTNDFLLRLAEGGIISHWKKTMFNIVRPLSFESGILGMMNSQEELRKFIHESIYHVFQAYCVATAFCIVIFWAELAVHRFRSTRRNRRLNNLNLFKISRHLSPRSASRQSD